jgi:hypothetical protein
MKLFHSFARVSLLTNSLDFDEIRLIWPDPNFQIRPISTATDFFIPAKLLNSDECNNNNLMILGSK